MQVQYEEEEEEAEQQIEAPLCFIWNKSASTADDARLIQLINCMLLSIVGINQPVAIRCGGAMWLMVNQWRYVAAVGCN